MVKIAYHNALLSLCALTLGVVGTLLPFFVALVPRLGPKPLYRLQLARTGLALGSLIIALATYRRRPSSSHLAILSATSLLAGLSYFFNPKRIFVALSYPPHTTSSLAGLGEGALVLGVENGNAVCAWPLEMVIPHHLMNDSLGPAPVLVSY